MSQSFFHEQSEQSLEKALIVAEYFDRWAQVMMGTLEKQPTRLQQVLYVDLFAGPGRYNDGKASTPLLILQRAIRNPKMRQMLLTMFNDGDENNTHSLQQAIDNLSGIQTLKHQPQVYNKSVGDNVVAMFANRSLPPTLTFIDPWGYKGLSLRLVNAVIKDWGCDCIFFFNYTRINMAVNNDAVQIHLEALFGEVSAAVLRERVSGLTPAQRELTILEALVEAFQGMGGKYVLPFAFKNEQGKRTSHYLIFVSKHFRGYELMKEVMAIHSSIHEQGVASFTYCEADQRQPLLFELGRPIDDLAPLLLRDFAGQTLTMQQIYERHNVNTPYIKSHYKQVLRTLLLAQKISTNRRPRTGFPEDVVVTFPP